MTNKINIGGKWLTIDDDYRRGAMHARVELIHSGYEDNGTLAWKSGFSNEIKRQHIRFGVDVVNARDTGRRFEEERSFDTTENGQWLAAYLEATGAMECVRNILGSSPGATRQTLKQEGVEISTRDCAYALCRLRFEKERRGVPLTDAEQEAVEVLSGPRKQILMLMAEWSESNWHTSVKSQDISWLAKRSSGWAASTALKMEREGMGYLFEFISNGYAVMKGKGWTAYELVKNLDAQRELDASLTSSPTMR